MRTTIALVFGFRAVASVAKRQRATGASNGTWWFIGLWLAATVADFFVGVGAGHGVALELGVHALIFAVPAALAWYLRRRGATATDTQDMRPSSDE